MLVCAPLAAAAFAGCLLRPKPTGVKPPADAPSHDLVDAPIDGVQSADAAVDGGTHVGADGSNMTDPACEGAGNVFDAFDEDMPCGAGTYLFGSDSASGGTLTMDQVAGKGGCSWTASGGGFEGVVVRIPTVPYTGNAILSIAQGSNSETGVGVAGGGQSAFGSGAWEIGTPASTMPSSAMRCVRLRSDGLMLYGEYYAQDNTWKQVGEIPWGSPSKVTIYLRVNAMSGGAQFDHFDNLGGP